MTSLALVGSEGRDVTLGRVGRCQTSIALAKLLCPLTIREVFDFVLVLVATGTDFVHFNFLFSASRGPGVLSTAQAIDVDLQGWNTSNTKKCGVSHHWVF